MKIHLPPIASFAAICLFFLLGSVAPALALGGGGGSISHNLGDGWWHHKHHRHHAPELDPGALGDGIVLAVGSILVLIERRRQR